MKRKVRAFVMAVSLLVCTATGFAQSQDGGGATSPSASFIQSVTDTVSGIWDSIVTWLVDDAPDNEGNHCHTTVAEDNL